MCVGSEQPHGAGEDDLPAGSGSPTTHEGIYKANKGTTEDQTRLGLLQEQPTQWDKQAGRAGDPPGLSTASGSSKAHKVSPFGVLDKELNHSSLSLRPVPWRSNAMADEMQEQGLVAETGMWTEGGKTVMPPPPPLVSQMSPPRPRRPPASVPASSTGSPGPTPMEEIRNGSGTGEELDLEEGRPKEPELEEMDVDCPWPAMRLTQGPFSTPPPPPRPTSAPPPDPTASTPDPRRPSRSRPEPAVAADLPKPPAGLPGIGEEWCSCLVDLRNFCSKMRGIAGPEGITPSLLFTRTLKEAKQDFSLKDLNWGIRKVEAECEVSLTPDSNPELVSKLVTQEVPQLSEAMAISSEGAVKSGTPIPAPQIEGLLSMEINSNWNGYSSVKLNRVVTSKRKRSF